MTQVPNTKGIAGLSKQEKRDLLENLLQGESAAQQGCLSEAQRRLWELEAHVAPQAIHTFSLAYFLRGSLRSELLEKAIQAVAARHDALRVRIAIVAGEPFFELGSASEVDFQFRDCQEPEIGRENMLKEEAARPLDLTAKPAWRCVLFRCSEEEHILLLQFHHIVADRWSAAIFVTELGAAYSALLEGGRPFISSPPSSRFSGSEHHDLPGGADLATQLAYWKGLLSNAPQMLELPSIHRGGGFGGYAGERVETDLDANVVAALKDLATSQSTTLFPVLLAAFALLLRAHTGQEDLIICTPMTGRHRAGTRGAIGYFNKIIPLRLDLRGDPSFASLVSRVAAQVLQAYAHQDVPLGLIAELPELAGVRLTRCLFALQNIPGLDLHLPGVVASYRDVPNGSANFDLSLFLEEKNGQLRVLLDYKSTVIGEAVAQQLRDRLLEFLPLVATQPGAHLSQLPRYQRMESTASGPAVAPDKRGKSTAADSLLEQRMIELWRELFSKSRNAIHADSHFFDLGGDSMQAARMFGRIETEFGQQLPMATLFEAPTPRQLVRRLSDKDWVAPWTSLIPLRTAGSRPPLFCVAGGGGNVLSFRHVADCLREDQPVYCLQAKGLKRGERPLTTVEEVADHYLDAVRRLTPHGPYLLTGHSFGAVVAYEMAQRLVRQGEKVALLAMLDYPGPDIRLTRIDWLRYHLISLSMQTPRERVHYIWRGILWKFKSARAARRIRKSQDMRPATDQDSRWSSIDVLEQSMRAIRSYEIKPYDGRIALFRGQHSDPKMVVDPQGGWGRVALKGVDVYEVPGSHMSIFKEPYVRELGAALARCLEKAHQKPDLETSG